MLDFWGREKKLKAITLTPKDKKVIQSFLAGKPESSRRLSTDGDLLEDLTTNVVLFYHIHKNKGSHHYILKNWRSSQVLNRRHPLWAAVSDIVFHYAQQEILLSHSARN